MTQSAVPRLNRYEASDGPISVLFLMATEAEYGPQLKKEIDPLITGVGPVEGGINATACIAGLSRVESPDLVISLGSAGSRTLPQGEVFQISSVSYRDMDASPLGFEKGQTPFSDLPVTIVVKPILDGLPSVSISTGADIVNGERYDDFSAELADMETYAHLRAAHRFNIPLIGLRGISDGSDPIEEFSDWTRYLAHIDNELANILRTLPTEFGRKPRSYWQSV